MGLQQQNPKHIEQGMNYCQKSLGQNAKYANAMVNMGLIFKFQGQVKDAHKMFKDAHDADKRNAGAIVNLGCIDYEFGRFEDAAISFLDALEIKPDDEEALCNLALALKKTP
jgi:tetratricopeptide (TPR) repeat protein